MVFLASAGLCLLAGVAALRDGKADYGFNARTDAILEIAATTLTMDDGGLLVIEETLDFQVDPFPGANLEPAALDFTGIDPESPDRNAQPEELVLAELFQHVRLKAKPQ